MHLKLQQATLIQRYKRFLADITLADNNITTIHCANTGAMTGCATPNDSVWYSTSDNKKRKYPFSWEVTQTQAGHFICVNTIRANQLIEEAINNQIINELTKVTQVKREVKYGSENSKIDFLITDQKNNQTFVEVKSVTLLHENQGYFPDAVTTRGQKHLRELIEMKESGHRAMLIFAVLHSGINSVSAARHVDPVYADLLQAAVDKGVEVVAYKANFEITKDISKIEITEQIPVLLNNN